MDPSTLSDEELDKKIAESQEVEEAPEVLEANEEAVDEPEEITPVEVEEQEEEPEQPEEPAPSQREQKRVRDLLHKYPQLNQQQPKREDRLDYGQALDADPEVIKQLESDRQREADTQYNAGLEQAKSMQFHTRLEIDAPKIEAKYPQLNPSSPEFQASDADDINSLYLYITGYDTQTGVVQNPNIRYAEFVESYMGLANRLTTRKVADSAKNIAKQAATTGLRPDGSSAKRMNLNQAPQNMTDEELEAVIAQAIPKR